MKHRGCELRGAATPVCISLVMSVLAGCAAGGASGPLTVRGELTYQARIALPADSVAIVELARAEDGRVVAEQRQALAGRQVPLRFELKPHPAVLVDGGAYFLRGVIAHDGRTQWLSDAVEVRARPGAIDVGTLMPAGPTPWASKTFFLPFMSGSARGSSRSRLRRIKAGRRDRVLFMTSWGISSPTTMW